MARRGLSNETRILFPWEGRRGLSRLRGLGHLRPVFVVLGVVGLLVLIGVRERRQAGIRRTRAALFDLRQAVDAYQAERDGGCPKSLDEVTQFGGLEAVPRDAWGREFRFVCPARLGNARYQLMSDGPDGEPGGLDRID